MNKQILRLAIPNIITNVTVPLLGMADTAIAGHLESELYIGAIAVAAIIFNFIYWNFSFLRMGTSGFAAQAFGAQNAPETARVLMRSLLVAVGGGVIIILLRDLFISVAFLFIDAGALTQIYIKDYFYVYIWAAPFVLCMYAFTGWFIGMQDAKTPMFISIAVNLINIGLSLLFVFGFHLQLKGLALGTALAQLCACVIALLILNKKYATLKPHFSFKGLGGWKSFKPFFSVNRDIFLRSLGLIAVSTFFIAASAKLGDTILAVNTLLIQLFSLFSYMMDGFAYAAEALAGRYYGGKDFGMLRRVVKRLFAWGIGMTVLFSGLYILFTGEVLRLLTDKQTIILAATQFNFWAYLFPIAGFAAFLWDGIFVGITASKEMRNSMFAAVVCFFSLYLLLTPSWGNNGLWAAFVSYLAARGLLQTILYRGKSF